MESAPVPRNVNTWPVTVKIFCIFSPLCILVSMGQGGLQCFKELDLEAQHYCEGLLCVLLEYLTM